MNEISFSDGVEPIPSNQESLNIIFTHIDLLKKSTTSSISARLLEAGYQREFKVLSVCLQVEAFLESSAECTEILENLASIFTYDPFESESEEDHVRSLGASFRSLVDELRTVCQPQIDAVLLRLSSTVASIGGSLNQSSALLAELPRREKEREDRFELIVQEFVEKTKDFRNLSNVATVLEYDNYLEKVEKSHRNGQTTAVAILIVTVLVILSAIFWPGLSGLLPKYSYPVRSAGVILDILVLVKHLSPAFFAVGIIFVSLRFFSLERHSLLMLRQKRSSIRLVISLLKELDLDESHKSDILSGVTGTLMRLHNTGYANRGLDPIQFEALTNAVKKKGS